MDTQEKLDRLEINYDYLKEENEKLKKENKKLKEERDNFMLKYAKAVEEKVVETNKLCTERNKLEEENKKLKSDLSECECSMHFENDEVWYRKRECKKLKEENQTLELWLDNKEKLNEEYRKQIDKYQRQYQHSMWFMEEDTLQELRDIGELKDDELIYEEWLYD